ncbi:MAG: prepilin-type N-terminal cleavage/methylation domain-containing protein [Fimbriimonadaceae bacterium]|nr:prepilin-type N-terminal cleavage/methylation domain-containing protein [Fimbriimonadaceae bacterium]
MRRKGFTLIEVLVVIAIIAILAAFLFPVFAKAKARSKQTACLSNMKQIGTAFALYMSDTDDLFPNGLDAVDKFQPMIWESEPEFFAQIPDMPLLSDLLQPYLKNREVFHSPADYGLKVLDDRPWLPLVAQPSVYGKFGSSYFYRTELTFRRIYHSSLPQPSESNMMETASGAWHAGAPLMDESIQPEEWQKRIMTYRYNLLYTDFHARSVSFAQQNEAWAVPIQ